MKNFTLNLGLLFAFIFVFTPKDVLMAQSSKNVDSQHRNSKGCLVKQFEFRIPRGCVAFASDGEYFYLGKNAGRNFVKIDLYGNQIEEFTISGMNSGVSTLAYDGRFFWAAKEMSKIYKIDMQANPPAVVSTITSPVYVKHCSYDPTADNGNGGLWVGSWIGNSDLVLLSLTGTELDRIPVETHQITTILSTAVDTITPGNPFLWAIDYVMLQSNVLAQLDLVSGKPTGESYSLIADNLLWYGDIVGGMLIMPDLVPGTISLVMLIQDSKILAFDMSGFIPRSNDLGVTSIDMQYYIPNNANYSVSGTIQNFGIDTINSYKINYQIDNEDIQTDDVTGDILAQGEQKSFTHITLVEPVLGDHKIRVWTSLPNGMEDEFPINDTLEYSYLVYDPIPAKPRTSLLEGFTSSTCAPCVLGNSVLKDVLSQNNGNYALIKYQVSWPGFGDPYYTMETKTRADYYGVRGVPYLHIDGFEYKTVTAALSNDVLMYAQSISAIMELNAEYYVDGQTIHANVNLKSTIDIFSDINLFIAIVEKRTVNNQGSNGETEFFQVFKKFMPDDNGIILHGITANTLREFEQEWEFKGNYRLPKNSLFPINDDIEHSVEDFNNLTIVAWVQNMQDGTVYQACNGVQIPVNINENKMISDIKLYPNPFTNKLTISNSENLAQITIVNILGQPIKEITCTGTNSIIIDTEELISGVYLLFVQAISSEKRVHKIIKL